MVFRRYAVDCNQSIWCMQDVEVCLLIVEMIEWWYIREMRFWEWLDLVVQIQKKTKNINKVWWVDSWNRKFEKGYKPNLDPGRPKNHPGSPGFGFNSHRRRTFWPKRRISGGYPARLSNLAFWKKKTGRLLSVGPGSWKYPSVRCTEWVDVAG